MTSFADHIPVLIIVIPLISALVTLAAGWIDKRTSFFITVTTVSGQFVASLFLLYRVQTQGTLRYWLGGWQPPWGIEYVIDGLNAYVLVVVLLMALICVVYSKKNIEHELPQKRITFYTLLQLLITGLCGITVTGDIFNMYVFIEIMSLSAYALTASRGKIALKASFTYLILGSIGACFFLLGIGFLYAITGSLNMQDLAQLLPPFYSNKMVTAAFVFFLVGLSIKMALFPLHTWLPDAHAFAPSEISALLSGIIIEICSLRLHQGYVFGFHRGVHPGIPHPGHPLLGRRGGDPLRFVACPQPAELEADARLFERSKHGVYRPRHRALHVFQVAHLGRAHTGLHAYLESCPHERVSVSVRRGLHLQGGSLEYCRSARDGKKDAMDIRGLCRCRPLYDRGAADCWICIKGLPHSGVVGNKTICLCGGPAFELVAEPGLFWTGP